MFRARFVKGCRANQSAHMRFKPSRSSAKQIQTPSIMKTKLTSIAVLLAGFGCFFASPLSANPARMHKVDRVLVPGSFDISMGASDNHVRQSIGSADQQLTPNLWVYHNFSQVRAEAGDPCRELVIRFEKGRVADIYADDRARNVIARRITSGKPEYIALGTVPEKPAGIEVASVN